MKKKLGLVVAFLSIVAGLLLVLTVPYRNPQLLATTTPTATSIISPPDCDSQLVVVTTLEATDQPSFRQIFPTPERSPTPTLTPELSPSPTSTPKPRISPEMFSGMIMLEIPAIKVYTRLEAALPKEGEEELDFSKINESPLWVSYTREIGEPGVALVLGHRQWGPNPKVFAKVNQLKKGDIIRVATSQYDFHFVIQEANVVVNPEKVWETIEKHDTKATEINQSILALLTCTPYGTDWQRLMVFANLKEVKLGATTIK